ncbi:Ceramide kinase-like protein [Drosera capensis]
MSESKMDRHAVDDDSMAAIGELGSLPSRSAEQRDGETVTLSSAFLLDRVGEVVLVVDGSGLSWTRAVESHNDEAPSFLSKNRGSSYTGDINFSDIYAVELINSGLIHASKRPKARDCFQNRYSEMYRFTVHSVERSRSKPSVWSLATHTFGHNDVQILEAFFKCIDARLGEELGRPKSLLVFVHPLSGKQNGRRTWDLVFPVFSRARVKTKVILTERAGHAFDVMTSMTNAELKSYDGVIAVGGDGLFNEILNGLLSSRLKAPYPPVPPDFMDSLDNEGRNLSYNPNEVASSECEDQSPHSPLLRSSGDIQSGFPRLRTKASDCNKDEDQNSNFYMPNQWFRFGIIPAGSTDAIVICTTGVRDPITSALHIVLGKRVSLDIAQVVNWKETSSSKVEPSVRYTASFVGYGFYGDVIAESEKYRWMGPKRYDFAGTKVFLRHRSYEAEIAYLDSNSVQKIPDTEHKDLKGSVRGHCPADENPDRVICRAKCQVCSTTPISTYSGEPPPTLHSDNGYLTWMKSKGKFLSLGAAVISCRNERAPDGLVVGAHLSDGFLHLVLIKECPHALYLRHLIELTKKGGKPLGFRFVEHHKSPVFAFTSFGDESVWNLDGEILRAHKLSAQVFRGLISLFATGPEV